MDSISKMMLPMQKSPPAEASFLFCDGCYRILTEMPFRAWVSNFRNSLVAPKVACDSVSLVRYYAGLNFCHILMRAFAMWQEQSFNTLPDGCYSLNRLSNHNRTPENIVDMVTKSVKII
jgi:hypothetical protein